MTKKTDFLWAVQTMLLSEQIKMSTNEKIIKTERRELGIELKHDSTIRGALNGSNHIPENMTAFQAAYELVFSMIREDKTPAWAKPHDESEENPYEHPALRALK